MTIEWLVTALLILLGGGAFLRRQLAFERTLKESIATGCIAPTIEWIQTRPTKNQADQYHQAITYFWKGYERSLAAEVAKTFLETHPALPVAHFWVKEVLSIEPAIGAQILSSEFLEREFNPELAACCGPTG